MIFGKPSREERRTCEIAYSLESKREFIPAASVIKVLAEGNGRCLLIYLAEESAGSNLVPVTCRECARCTVQQPEILGTI